MNALKGALIIGQSGGPTSVINASAYGVIRTALATVSELTVLQMQDLLDLGGEARMNCPGLCDGTNWVWRARDGVFTHELAQKLGRVTRLYGR